MVLSWFKVEVGLPTVTQILSGVTVSFAKLVLLVEHSSSTEYGVLVHRTVRCEGRTRGPQYSR